MSITDEYFESALRAYGLGDYSLAESALLKVLSLEPYSSETLLNLGNVYYKQDDLEGAEEKWLKAIEINPMEDKAYLNLGNLYFSREEHKKAVYYWEIFQKLHPTHPNIHLNLGLAYEALSELPKAFRNYRVYIRLEPISKDSYQLKRRMVEAEKIARHNIKQAEAHMKGGRLLKAKQAFELGAALVPLHPKVYKHYATVLYQLGELTQAIVWYEKAYDLMPNDPGTLINLGIIHEKTGNDFQAMWAYHAAIKADPRGVSGKVKQRFKNLWEQKGVQLIDKTLEEVKVYIETCHYDEAEELSQRLFDVAFSKAAGKLPEIKTTMEFLENRKDPRRLAANIAYSLAEEYKTLGQYEKALHLYNRYINLLPNGERAAEIKTKQDQIEKTISAVIGGLLEQKEPSQTVA